MKHISICERKNYFLSHKLIVDTHNLKLNSNEFSYYSKLICEQKVETLNNIWFHFFCK